MGGGRSQEDRSYDFDRLEGAVDLLLASHDRLREENVLLRQQLDERAARLRQLDEQLLEQNQRKHDALKRIAQIAIEKEMGARGLRTIMEELMLDLMYELPSTRDVKEVLITEAVVDETEEPLKVLKKAS